MKTGITARQLRGLLIVMIIATIVAIVSGFIFVQAQLNGYATEISHLNARAQSGDQDIATLRGLEERLQDEAPTIAAARSVVADQSNYSDRVIADITRIAAESGVSVTSIAFSEADTSTPATPATPPAQTTPAPATSAPTASTVPGVSKRTVTITLQSPLPYSSLLGFIERLESNQLEMQLPSLSITKDQGDLVTTQTLILGVYVRS